MNNSRVADRLGGFIIGLPTVAFPIWIAGWSPWLGVITTTLFLVVAVSYVCGITPKWFQHGIAKLIGTKVAASRRSTLPETTQPTQR